MKAIYLFRDCYNPNSATNNRLMAFVKGFDEIGIKTEMVFIRANEKQDKATEKYPNTTFHYLWENKVLSDNKSIKFFQQFLWIIPFLRRMKKGENILLFGTNEFAFLFAWFGGKRNIYHEVTEHPDACLIYKSIKTKISQRLYQRSLKHFKGVFVISKPLKSYYEQHLKDKKDVHVINMTVDGSRFKNLEKSTNEKYITYCGSMSNKKDGVDDLIRAFALVLQKVDDVKLMLIGRYVYKADEDFNFGLIERLGLMDRIVHSGVITYEEMPQILKNAQTLVLARPDSLQARNGFPTKLGEYLLTGNPVVVTKTGDIPLFLNDGINAYLAEPGNVEDIANKIIHSLTDDNAMEIGKNGCSVAVENFNYLNETKKMCQVIFDDFKNEKEQ